MEDWPVLGDHRGRSDQRCAARSIERAVWVALSPARHRAKIFLRSSGVNRLVLVCSVSSSQALH